MKNIKEEKLKNPPLERAVLSSRNIYIKRRVNKIQKLKEKFNSGQINKYQFISQMYENNKMLFEISEAIKWTDIRTIIISKETVVFLIDPFGIQLEVDKSCRSAPFEILTFGNYEFEDELMAFNLIQNGDVVFDVGAHIGWYALNLAKRFPRSKIYSFEPLLPTYKFLERNIKRNHVQNIKISNFGLSDRDSSPYFFYSEIGSPLASLKNISRIDTYQKIRCRLKKLDDVVSSEKLNRLDFIKCDVEGSELLVLQGGQMMIEKFCPVLFIEIVESWCQKFAYSSNDILNFLRYRGYKAYLVLNGCLKEVKRINPNNVEKFNYFFLHNKKHKLLQKKYCVQN